MRVQPSAHFGIHPRTRWKWVLAGMLVFVVGAFVGRHLRHSEPSGLSQPPAPTAKFPTGVSWSVATYNLHNFFDNLDHPYAGERTTKAKTETELQTLAQAIRQLDADVLMMQEVQTGGLLAHFNQHYLGGAEAGMRYAYVVDEPSRDVRGIGLGVLSRFPITRIVSHRTIPLDTTAASHEKPRFFARDLLRVDFLPLGQTPEVTLYGFHLKSKRAENTDLLNPGETGSEASARHRLAEVRTAKRIIQQEMASAGHGRFLLAGDFNDGPDSEPVRVLISGPGWEKLGPPDLLAGEMGVLVDALRGLPATERMSYPGGQLGTHPTPEQARAANIDQIWLSPLLAQEQLPVTQDGAKVFRGTEFERASDHRPVRVRLGSLSSEDRP